MLLRCNQKEMGILCDLGVLGARNLMFPIFGSMEISSQLARNFDYCSAMQALVEAVETCSYLKM